MPSEYFDYLIHQNARVGPPQSNTIEHSTMVDTYNGRYQFINSTASYSGANGYLYIMWNITTTADIKTVGFKYSYRHQYHKYRHQDAWSFSEVNLESLSGVTTLTSPYSVTKQDYDITITYASINFTCSTWCVCASYCRQAKATHSLAFLLQEILRPQICPLCCVSLNVLVKSAITGSPMSVVGHC